MVEKAPRLIYQRFDGLDFKLASRGRQEQIAKGVQRVLRLAYTRAFEGQNTLYRLPPGTVAERHFNENEEQRVMAQADRIRRHTTERESVYWLAWDDEDGEMAGLAKTTPTIPANRNRFEPDCYLNDIAVAVPLLGIGTALMDKAISDFPFDARVELHAYDGNEVANSWFGRLGFEETEPEISIPSGIAVEIADTYVPIPLRSLAAPTVRSVLEKLRHSN